MKDKLLITGAILILVLLGMCYYQHGKIVKFRTDSERNRANVEVLMGEVQRSRGTRPQTHSTQPACQPFRSASQTTRDGGLRTWLQSKAYSPGTRIWHP